MLQCQKMKCSFYECQIKISKNIKVQAKYNIYIYLYIIIFDPLEITQAKRQQEVTRIIMIIILSIYKRVSYITHFPM